MKTLALALCLLLPALARADDAGFNTSRLFTASGEALDDVALNASSATTRTATVRLNSQYTMATVGVYFTWAAASAVTSTCYKSIDAGARWLRVTAGSISSGTRTLSLLGDSLAVTASVDYGLEYDVRGADYFKCVFSGAGVGASDFVDVQIKAVVGK